MLCLHVDVVITELASIVFFELDVYHRDLHVLTHPFPTLRSSDLVPRSTHHLPMRKREKRASSIASVPAAPLIRSSAVRARRRRSATISGSESPMIPASSPCA